MFDSARLKNIVVVALSTAVFLPVTGVAQEKENMAKIAELGGSMHAISETCGTYSPDQLKQMKAGQQSASAAGGLSAAEFEAAFTKSYEATKVKIASGTVSQKQAMCEQAQKMQH